MDTLKVEQYMEYQPASILCDTVLTDVIKILLEHKTSGAPVVDSEHHVIGFVSEQDCLKSLLVSGYFCDNIATAKDVMRSDVLTVTPQDNVVELARRMTDQQPKIYPVVVDTKLVGLIDRRRVLEAISKSQLENIRIW